MLKDLRIGNAVDLLDTLLEEPDLIVTDPPYAFGGEGEEHQVTAHVAIALREAARRLKDGRWMLVFSASSSRSLDYMKDSLRGLVTPVRDLTWCKPRPRTRVRTAGPQWASVKVSVFRKGKGLPCPSSEALDWIVAEPMTVGRRAQLPLEVARWAVGPYSVPEGLFLDPFSGSGALCDAAVACGMRAIGFEKQGRPLSISDVCCSNMVMVGSVERSWCPVHGPHSQPERLDGVRVAGAEVRRATD